ncbi:MAG: hypothetical protein ABSF51_08510 [Verrucomicrobiota bacterium]|jgi:hypothetical protein
MIWRELQEAVPGTALDKLAKSLLIVAYSLLSSWLYLSSKHFYDYGFHPIYFNLITASLTLCLLYGIGFLPPVNRSGYAIRRFFDFGNRQQLELPPKVSFPLKGGLERQNNN